jgi:FKBP-type peptidyl-prolyl cis-trans isomerase
MRVGGISQLVIPAKLAYGDSPPSGSIIPKNAVLVFQVKLLSTS